jgi:hypothetical protein
MVRQYSVAQRRLFHEVALRLVQASSMRVSIIVKLREILLAGSNPAAIYLARISHRAALTVRIQLKELR